MLACIPNLDAEEGKGVFAKKRSPSWQSLLEMLPVETNFGRLE
jgi:hypothetical protein